MSRKDYLDKHKSYVYKDLHIPTLGIHKYFWKPLPIWESILLNYIEGGKNSTAEKMVKFIEENYTNYLFRRRYKLMPEPNCNKFIQLIIKHFPESGSKLPKRAFGKNYPTGRISKKIEKNN